MQPPTCPARRPVDYRRVVIAGVSDAQRGEHAAGVTEIADDMRAGRWRQLGETGGDEHAVVERAPRMLTDVDDFQLVASFRCSRQIASRLAMALTELGARPATYRRMTTTVVTDSPCAPSSMRLRATTRSLLPVAVPAGFSPRAALLDAWAAEPAASAAIPAAQSAHFGLLFAGRHVPRRIVARVERERGALPLEIELQGRDARGGIRLGELQLAALVRRIPFREAARGISPRLPFPSAACP